jgi:hypothetical protein
MKIENFEEFTGEFLQAEELPCIVGGVETEEGIRQAETGPVDMDNIQ